MSHAIDTDAMDLDTEDEDPEEDPFGGSEESNVDSDQDASYCCWACGEEIVIPIDPTMGARQDYVEDCPVCCRPNEIHVELDPHFGDVRCWNDPVG